MYIFFLKEFRPSKDSLDLGVSGACWGIVDDPWTGDWALFDESSLCLRLLGRVDGVRRIRSNTSLGNKRTVSPCSTSTSSSSSSASAWTFSSNDPKTQSFLYKK